ncbi:hypothetical protein FQZ97_1216710 [compost metagenome]
MRRTAPLTLVSGRLSAVKFKRQVKATLVGRSTMVDALLGAPSWPYLSTKVKT